MATLQTIRNKAGVLVSVIIGLALIAFILGDFLSSGGRSAGQADIAKIDGKNISWQEFAEQLEANIESYKNNTNESSLDESMMSNLREQTWNQILNNYLLEEEYKELGISVSPDELFDMVQGQNVHPEIKQIPIFINQTTGEFDPILVIQFLKSLDSNPSMKQTWVAFENQLLNVRQKDKFNNLLSKGFYVTDFKANLDLQQANTNFEAQYIVKRPSTLSDSLISYTEEEVKEYYRENKESFKQLATRDVSYVAFDIVPSDLDRNTAEQWINNIKDEFSTIENAENFVRLNSDQNFDGSYKTKEQLPENLQEALWEQDKDAVFGPYLEEDVYKIARITDVVFLPDSVQAKHILIRPNPETPQDMSTAQATADSLVNLIKGGQKFEDLAKEYGTDASADKGGDLGWFTKESMVTEFSDACFYGKKGDLTTAQTQFGVHVIKITDQAQSSKKMQIAILARVITPSSQTRQEYYNQASKFASEYGTAEKFDIGITDERLAKRLANNLREDQVRLSGFENPRELIRWAFKGKEGDISPIFTIDERFIVAKIDIVREEGISPLEDVRGQVENSVKNEKKKEVIAEQFTQAQNASTTLQETADKLKLPVKDSKDFTILAYSMPGIGAEHQVMGILSTMEDGQVSEPIIGRNGVFIVKLVKKTSTASSEFSDNKTKLLNVLKSRAEYQGFQAIIENADIEDNRHEFF